MSGFVDVLISFPTPRTITVTMEEALAHARRFPVINIQVLSNPSFRDLLAEAVNTRENMETIDPDEDEIPDLISSSSTSTHVVEIEMENVEEHENLSEYERLN